MSWFKDLLIRVDLLPKPVYLRGPDRRVSNDRRWQRMSDGQFSEGYRERVAMDRRKKQQRTLTGLKPRPVPEKRTPWSKGFWI